MLGPIDNIVNAGIRFESDLRDIDKAESKLKSLSDNMKSAAAGGVALSEGTNKANRSLSEQARDAGAASSGLAGLQTQLASTRLAQESLEDSSGSLSHTLRDLDNDAQSIIIDEVVEDVHSAVNDLNALPNDFDFDAHIDGREETREFVKLLGGVDGTEFSDLFRFDSDDLDAVESAEEILDGIEDLDPHTNPELRFNKYFGEYDGTKYSDFELDPRSDNFPNENSNYLPKGGLGTHIFDQLSRNTDYSSFGEVYESDDELSDLIDADVFPGMGQDRELTNINGDGASLFDSQSDIDGPDLEDMTDLEREQYESQNSGGSSTFDKIEKNLDDLGVKTVDDFFRASDEKLEEAMDSTKLGNAGAKADDLRQSAIDALKTREFTDDKGITRTMDADDDDGRFGGSRYIAQETHRDALKGFKDPASLENDIMASSKVGGENFEWQDEFIDLTAIMRSNDAINKLVTESEDLEETIENIGELDLHDQLQVRKALVDNKRTLAASSFNAKDISERIGVSDKDDFFDKLVSEGGFAPGEAETLANTMSELDPALVKGQGQGNSFPVTRETLGLRTMQEMFDTDPDSDRQDTLQSMMQSIYHPDEGISETLFDDAGYMTGDFYEGLRDELPNELTTSGGFGEGRNQKDLASDITRELYHGSDSEGMGVEDYIGDDSKNVSELVSRAVNRADYDDPQVLGKGSKGTENFLPKVYELFASQLAPGLNTSARGSTASKMSDLFPGEDILDPAGSPDEAGERQLPFSGWMERMNETFGNMRKSQKASPGMRGGMFTGLFGGEGNKKGLFGFLSEGFASSSMGSSQRVTKFNEGIEQMKGTYEELIPMLNTTSLNLGPLNARFESVGRMVFKLTALIGPLVVALGGLAGAALTATGAMASFMGAGALGFFEDMEDTMAGVSDKQDAMSELASTLGKMAQEAIMPLQMARLGGDGNTAAQSFVELLRGGLQILNRVANIFAYVMELEEVGDQAERISNFLLNADGDGELARQFGQLVTDVLPLINDIVIGILGNMGAFASYASSITESLGGQFVQTLSDLHPLFKLMSTYGAGFFEGALMMISGIASSLGLAVSLFDSFLSMVSFIPGITGDVEQFEDILGSLVFSLGMLVGSFAVLGGLGRIISAQMYLIGGSFKGAAKLASFLTATNYGLATSFFIVASAVSLLLIQFWLLRDIIERLDNLEPEMSWDFAEDISILIGEFMALGAAFATTLAYVSKFKTISTIATGIAGKLGISAATLASWKISLAGIVTALKVGVLATLKGIVATIAGFSAVTWGVIAVLLLAGAVIGDLVYWLATGETFLIRWDDHLASIADKWDSINKDASEHFETVRDHTMFGGTGSTGDDGGTFQTLWTRIKKNAGTPSTGGSTMQMMGGSGGFGITSQHVKALGIATANEALGGGGGSSDAANTMSSQSSAHVEVNIDQSMSNKQIARVAKREIKNWWQREMN